MSGGMAATAVRHCCIRQWTACSRSGSKKRKKVTINRCSSVSGGRDGIVAAGSRQCKVWKWRQKKKKGNNQLEERQREWWHGGNSHAKSWRQAVDSA